MKEEDKDVLKKIGYSQAYIRKVEDMPMDKKYSPRGENDEANILDNLIDPMPEDHHHKRTNE